MKRLEHTRPETRSVGQAFLPELARELTEITGQRVGQAFLPASARCIHRADRSIRRFECRSTDIRGRQKCLPHWCRIPLFILCLIITLLAVPLRGAENQITWSGTATDGKKVEIPTTGTTVVVFVRADQAQSRSALEQIKQVIVEKKEMKVIVVASGERARDAGTSIAGADSSWPVVVDGDFAVSGKFGVHVWPTTVVVNAKGEQVGHLAGLRGAFASDLEDYLDFAAGRIDSDMLAKRLIEHEFVSSGSEHKADRHLIVATHLLESGQLEQAQAQLTAGLAANPNDAKLSVMLVRVLLLQEQPAEALKRLDALPAGAVPTWQLSLLRGRALVALERWDDARAIMPDAIKLNPHPAEAHYLMGLIAQHDSQWQQAAEEFRRAYELSAKSR